jgi:hypothetical protein
VDQPAQQDVPQTNRPSEHVIPDVPPSPTAHVSEQVAVAAHVMTQLLSHLMSQRAWSSHATVLVEPRLILHTDMSLHVAIEPAPALRSQLEVMPHVIRLPSPPFPLHSDVSSQLSVSGPFVLPLHLAAAVQSSEQALSPHSAWQSAPAKQIHAESVHAQPVPVHVAGMVSPPPHPALTERAMTRMCANRTIRMMTSSFSTALLQGADRRDTPATRGQREGSVEHASAGEQFCSIET